MKLKIIFPPCKYSPRVSDIPPAGIAKVAGALRKNGHDVDQDDLNAKIAQHNKSKPLLSLGIDPRVIEREERVIRYLNGEKDHIIDKFLDKALSLTSLEGYDAICFSSLMLWQAYSSMLLAKRIRETRDTPIIFGGASASVIFSEKFSKIPSIQSMLEDGRAHEIYALFNPQEIDAQMPDYDGLPLGLYRHRYFGENFSLYYELDKGCKYKCGFCTFRVKAPYRKMDVQKALQEIGFLHKKYGTPYFEFGTDMINSDHDALHEFCDGLIKKNIGITWLSYASPAMLDGETLQKMARSGCILLKYGIESGSESMLRRMRKPFTLEQASNVLAWSKKAGIHSRISIIAGFPHESREDIRATAAFFSKHESEISSIRVSDFTLFTSSDIWQHPERYGVENVRPINSLCNAFDETGGLKWEEKKQQIHRSFISTKAAAHRITRSNYSIYSKTIPKFLPFAAHWPIQALSHRFHFLGALVNNPIPISGSPFKKTTSMGPATPLEYYEVF